MKKMAVVLMMVVLALGSMLLAAQDDMQRPRMHRGGMMMFGGDHAFRPNMLLHAKEELGLSAEQVKKLEALQTAHQEMAIKKRADMELAGLKLKNYMDGENVNRKEAEKMIRALAGQHADMQVANFNFFSDAKALLTAEQLKKLEQLKGKMHHSVRDRFMQDRRGHRGEMSAEQPEKK